MSDSLAPDDPSGLRCGGPDPCAADRRELAARDDQEARATWQRAMAHIDKAEDDWWMERCDALEARCRRLADWHRAACAALASRWESGR